MFRLRAGNLDGGGFALRGVFLFSNAKEPKIAGGGSRAIALLAALYHYAMKHRVDRYLEGSRTELNDTNHMIQHAMEKLEAAGADTLISMYQEAGFLAGLSIGLELGRL